MLKEGGSDRDIILFNLEKLIILRMIAKIETKSYNKLCREFIISPNSIADRVLEIPFEKINDGIMGIKNRQAMLLLFWIELNRRHRDKKFDSDGLKYEYSLEHIMPQKWEQKWQNMPEKYLPST